MTVECLECGAAIMIPLDADEGDTLTCKKCGETFVILGLHPVEIDYAVAESGADDQEWDEEWDEDWLGDDELDDEEEDW